MNEEEYKRKQYNREKKGGKFEENNGRKESEENCITLHGLGEFSCL